ncbi:hypothetical protein EYZ11_009862 [Aspergillus tanneri]|uniref:Uncharacterized protein n=1 Tax=Aspergillus tanneri TaxID=1220188 RepID=A0A4S3J6U0_9EURO|nr:hypothetical protein EYZ11_009862 [Aspergillus tanneri]
MAAETPALRVMQVREGFLLTPPFAHHAPEAQSKESAAPSIGYKGAKTSKHETTAVP